MSKRYKLTDANACTKGGMQWAVGVTNHATGTGSELCTDGYLHVYDSPEQAVFMRSAQVPKYTRIFEVECPDDGITDGTKRSVKEATVLREVRLPRLSTTKRVEIAIRCALLVCHDKAWRKWAHGWLDGTDRSRSAASSSAADAAGAAAYAADSADAAHAAAAAAADASYNKPIPLLRIINRVMERGPG